MKTKLEMAHEWYLKHSENPSFMNTEVEMAWQYADAMQAEVDKRLTRATHKEEWQPDWSQAPADACCWFIGGKSWDVKPYWSKYIPCYKNEETQTTWQGDGMIEAPSFGYTGDWRKSLRKRPQ